MDLGSDHQRLLNVIKSVFPVTDLHEIKGQRNIKCHKENNQQNPGYRKLYRKSIVSLINIWKEKEERVKGEPIAKKKLKRQHIDLIYYLHLDLNKC